MGENRDSVVFAKGECEVKTKYGTARVIIPRDITLDEVAHPLAKLFEGRKE